MGASDSEYRSFISSLIGQMAAVKAELALTQAPHGHTSSIPAVIAKIDQLVVKANLFLSERTDG